MEWDGEGGGGGESGVGGRWSGKGREVRRWSDGREVRRGVWEGGEEWMGGR